jgi:hypothetical protein
MVRQVAGDDERAAAKPPFPSSGEILRRVAVQWQEEAASLTERAAYHSALKQKYRQAADRPWRSIEPDGPEPMRE